MTTFSHCEKQFIIYKSMLKCLEEFLSSDSLILREFINPDSGLNFDFEARDTTLRVYSLQGVWFLYLIYTGNEEPFTFSWSRPTKKEVIISAVTQLDVFIKDKIDALNNSL